MIRLPVFLVPLMLFIAENSFAKETVNCAEKSGRWQGTCSYWQMYPAYGRDTFAVKNLSLDFHSCDSFSASGLSDDILDGDILQGEIVVGKSYFNTVINYDSENASEVSSEWSWSPAESGGKVLKRKSRHSTHFTGYTESEITQSELTLSWPENGNLRVSYLAHDHFEHTTFSCNLKPSFQ